MPSHPGGAGKQAATAAAAAVSDTVCVCVCVCPAATGTYTTACDVWSFGILMWEVFSFGSSPYPGLTNAQASDKVVEGNHIQWQ